MSNVTFYGFTHNSTSEFHPCTRCLPYQGGYHTHIRAITRVLTNPTIPPMEFYTPTPAPYSPTPTTPAPTNVAVSVAPSYVALSPLAYSNVVRFAWPHQAVLWDSDGTLLSQYEPRLYPRAGSVS